MTSFMSICTLVSMTNNSNISFYSSFWLFRIWQYFCFFNDADNKSCFGSLTHSLYSITATSWNHNDDCVKLISSNCFFISNEKLLAWFPTDPFRCFFFYICANASMNNKTAMWKFVFDKVMISIRAGMWVLVIGERKRYFSFLNPVGYVRFERFLHWAPL